MKAVLVIDIPDYVDFNICKTVDVGLCFNVKEYTEPFIKSNVPLKPLPTKITTATLSEREQERTELFTSMALLKTYADGWNDCLEVVEK